MSLRASETSVAISREGELPQSSYPVHPIMGLPRSNFVLPRRDRKELSLRASETSVAISREGELPQSSYPVHPIMGLPRSNFVLPRRDRKELSLRASETSVAISGRSSPLRHATRATSPVSSGEPPDRVHLIFVIARSVATWQSPGRVVYREHIFPSSRTKRFIKQAPAASVRSRQERYTSD